MGTRISAQFLCLDGRVSGQSSERLLAFHSDPCLHFGALTWGCSRQGLQGRLRRLGFVLWAAGLYRSREFCVAALFLLTEDGPESPGRWPSPCAITPGQSPTGTSQRGQEAWGGSQKGVRCRACWGGV